MGMSSRKLGACQAMKAFEQRRDAGALQQRVERLLL
jgi:hypothetical protein